MVKFRCLRCSQKIIIEASGIGVVIDCPTCAEHLIVPPRSDHEFEGEPVALTPVLPEPEPDRVALVPHLVQLLKDRLVHALLTQRGQLVASQNAAADQVAAIEQRVALIQAKLQRRVAYYEERIADLQTQLAEKTTENEVLLRHYRELQKQVRPVPLGTAPRVKLDRRLLLST